MLFHVTEQSWWKKAICFDTTNFHKRLHNLSPRGISIKVDVWGLFSVREKKEANTISVIEKKVPHVKVLSEIVFEKYNPLWLGKPGKRLMTRFMKARSGKMTGQAD